MGVAIWTADWTRRAWLEPPPGARKDWRGPALEATAVPGTVLAALWAGGFFLLHGGHRSGVGSDFGLYGTWSFDLLGFLDPGNWSAVMPDLPDTGHWDSVGSHYLGLGGLLLLLAGAVGLALRPARLPRRLFPLATALFVLLAFAVTHRVAVAGRVWTLFEPPGWFIGAASALRNSTRMAVPLAYALLFGAIAAVARAWGGRRTGWLLLVLLAVQWADLRPGIMARGVAAATASRKPPEWLSDPFWAEAIRRYHRIRCAPAANMGPGWNTVGVLAARAGVPTDCIYLARVDPGASASSRAASSVHWPANDVCPVIRCMSIGCNTKSPAPQARASGSCVVSPTKRQPTSACTTPQASSQGPIYCGTSSTPRSALSGSASNGRESVK